MHTASAEKRVDTCMAISQLDSDVKVLTRAPTSRRER